MLLERNQALLGVIAAVVIGIGTVLAVGATGGAFVPGFPMSAEFEDAAGLQKGDFVYVAGVRSGQVTGVEIAGDHVIAEFNLQSEGVPADSVAEIILQSTLGRRAIKLIPPQPDPDDDGQIEQSADVEYFEEGDVIPMDRTVTPIDLPELGDRGADLLGNVDVQAMQDIIDAFNEITEGSRDDVVALLEGVQRVSDIVVERRDDLRRVIAQARSVVDTAADQDREIIRIIDAFGSTLDNLLANRTEITRLLEASSDTSNDTADLIAERRAQIDRILAEVEEDLAIVDRHQVDLAHVFAYAGVAFEGFASIGYSGGDAKIDNPDWGNVFTTGLGTAGIGAVLGCGGPVDDVLTALVGPDPGCADSTAPADGDLPAAPAATDPDRAQPLEAGAGGFFSPAVVLSRLEAPSTAPRVVAAGGEVQP